MKFVLMPFPSNSPNPAANDNGLIELIKNYGKIMYKDGTPVKANKLATEEIVIDFYEFFNMNQILNHPRIPKNANAFRLDYKSVEKVYDIPFDFSGEQDDTPLDGSVQSLIYTVEYYKV